MVIFPPTRRGYEPAVRYPAGLRYPGRPQEILWVKPAHYGYTFLFTAETSDVGFDKLFVQWAVVAVITASLIYILKSKKPKDEQKQ
jgi:hypothetical protein